MDDKTRQALDDIRKFLSHHEPYADSREVRCVTPFASEAPGMNLAAVRALYALAVAAAVPDVTFPKRCSRCGAEPAPNQARSLCDDCDPDTPLCQDCYVTHAREVLADAEDDPPTTFYHSNVRREKLQLAAAVVAAASSVVAEDQSTPKATVTLAIRPPEVLRTLRQADMTDAEHIALMEQNYRRLPDPPRFSLLEFMGMSPDEYAGWIMYGTVPERVMRVARRR